MSDVIVQLHVRARLDRLIDDINRKTPGKSVHCFFGTIHRFIMGYRVLNFRALSVSGNDYIGFDTR